jgi:hypothetical protein
VSDHSKGVLPGVTVTATHAETGVATPVVTNSDGAYLLPFLRLAAYTVGAELMGFKKLVAPEHRGAHRAIASPSISRSTSDRLEEVVAVHGEQSAARRLGRRRRAR